MNKRYQIQHDTTASMNSAAYITCPRRGKIVGVTWVVMYYGKVDSNEWQGELSFASVAQTDVNDPIGVISAAATATNVITTANGSAIAYGTIHFHDPMELAVLPGDRIIYNAVVSGANFSSRVRILVEIDEN